MTMINRFATIRARLTLWYIALLALTVLVFSFFLYYELQVILSDQIDAGIQVAASQLMVDVDDTVNPPILRPMSDDAAAHILQSSFASRMVTSAGTVVADVGSFPAIPFSPPEQAGFNNLEIDGVPWRIYSQQVETNNRQFDVWLQVGQSLNVINDTQQILFQLILIGLPIVLITTAFGGMFMASRALNPVDTITRTVKDIHATDMSKRITYQGPTDELSRLTETLNSMLDRLQIAFDTERRFTADASHELRTPLTAIKGHVSVTLTRERQTAEYVETLHRIQTETDRLIRVANDLLFLARLDASAMQYGTETVILSDLLGAIIDQMQVLADEKKILLKTEIPTDISIQGMTDHLIRLYLNILDNAIKYTLKGGEVSLKVEVDDHIVKTTISDTGRGIAPDHLPFLFERFYRAGRDQQSQSGSGLGLPIAHQIVRAHNGSIQIDSKPEQGTTVIICLPQTTPNEK